MSVKQRGNAFNPRFLHRHIDCCIELIDTAQISSLNIEQAEYYAENIHFPPSISHPKAIRQVITACLREQCWLKITSEDFFIHFGYDYYMYIGSVLPSERVATIAAKYGLYCELYPSPYRQWQYPNTRKITLTNRLAAVTEGFTPVEKDDIIHSNCKGCNSVCLPQHHSRQKADGCGTD